MKTALLTLTAALLAFATSGCGDSAPVVKPADPSAKPATTPAGPVP